MKRFLSITFGFIYLFLLAASLMALVKPGAAVFYRQIPVQNERLITSQKAYEYHFDLNTGFYNLDTLLVKENGRTLDPGTVDYTLAGGSGTFAVKAAGGGRVTLLISPAEASQTGPGEDAYTVIVRPHLIRRRWAGLAGLFLLAIPAVYLLTVLADSGKRSRLLASPLSLLQLLVDLPDRAADRVLEYLRARNGLVRQAAAGTFLAAFFYVFMEWVFFLTRPSFMDMLSLAEKLGVCLVSGLLAGLVSLLALPVIALLDLLLFRRYPAFGRYAFSLPAALVLACLGLILVDNFTYTLFGFGIVTSEGAVRALYAAGFLGLLVYILMEESKQLSSVPAKAFHWRQKAALGLAAAGLVLVALAYRPGNVSASQVSQVSGSGEKPNIILLSTDGLNAANMSAYGYERDTTPFIRQLAAEALFSENSFTNAATSTGSEVALLTGKLPFETRVLYPPDTLRGTDMYQHLPGILRMHGYRTTSLGVPYFVDMNTVNFMDAFDAVNCVASPRPAVIKRLSGYGFDKDAYLLSSITKRIQDRLEHIFFLRKMENPMAAVTEASSTGLTDQRRMKCLLNDLDEAAQAGQPLFAHVHMMGTHGHKFAPSRQVFSAGQEQTEEWMTDFYDDAILDFDALVERLVAYLKETGQYDNTILVLYTDHGQRWIVSNRLPLIFRFPQGEHAGTIRENTQILDVAPTLLDYLGIAIPEWMEGDSLLQPLDPDRLIVAGATNKVEAISGNYALPTEKLQPPFYQFTELWATQCQKSFVINLEQLTMSTREVPGHTSPCPEDALASEEEVWASAGELLERLGYRLPEGW